MLLLCFATIAALLLLLLHRYILQFKPFGTNAGACGLMLLLEALLCAFFEAMVDYLDQDWGSHSVQMSVA